MMIEIKIPGAGESITEVAIGTWLAENGSRVEKDQEIAEVETDKATLPLIAPESGLLSIRVKAGERVQVGDVACTIDTENAGTVVAGDSGRGQQQEAVAVGSGSGQQQEARPIKVTPLAKAMMEHQQLDVDAIIRGLRKISRQDVETVIGNQVKKDTAPPEPFGMGRKITRTPMSPLRRKLGKRLVAVKNETAMLTTFNEVDLGAVLDLRKKYQQQFQSKHGQKLGLMSFFAKACAEALTLFPAVNSMIDGDDMITPGFIDIAIAVQTEKGLMVPVIRDAQSSGIAGLEIAIAELAQKARNAKLTVEEMTGGTFTITNGGVFGSMLSTPILNPPQSAILGMHNITERPVALGGQVVIRPMMYIALSYDHRIIDGRDSVSFLLKIRELIESPLKMVNDVENAEKILLDL